MKPPRRGVTVSIVRDGDLGSTTYRLSALAFRAVAVAAIAVAIILVLGIALYAPIARQASRVPGLEREVERLTLETGRIRDLAAALESMEVSYAKLRSMVGADVVPDPVGFAGAIPVAPAIEVAIGGPRRRFTAGPSAPTHWPLEEPGYLTRGQVPTGSQDEAHPGIDLAVPVGTLVRAVGGGTVRQASEDPHYGLFVLIEHPSGFESMYGHLSRITTAVGRQVPAGEVIGRSGNTGRSSAPHLHLEIRREGISIDPLTLIREGR
ncbi:MAG: M23 family metallopeptidase [Gemmatimonadales bacterium]